MDEIQQLYRGYPPKWAVRWGEDEHGVHASFAVGRVVQRLRWIQPGSFLMGSPEGEEGRDDDEGPQHRVVLSGGYWLGSTVVTQGLWSLMSENWSFFQGAENPVEGVSWFDAVRFCNALSAKQGLELAYEVGEGEEPAVRLLAGSWGFRLPTEAEWEYACRAGTTTRFWSGDTEEDLARVGWYDANANSTTHPVAQKLVNPWGLYDMHGNIDEWCTDGWEYGAPYTGEARTNPVSRAGSYRVIRGGAWYNSARFARAASRHGIHPSSRNDYLGFRLARGPVQAREASSRGGAPGPRVPEARRDAGGLLVVPVRDEQGTASRFNVGGVEHTLRIPPGASSSLRRP